MSKEIEFLILTKSARFGGNCVVGLDLQTKRLIRLVTNNEKIKNSLSDYNMMYKNGVLAIPTDIVRIKILSQVPTNVQSENVLLDCSYMWEKVKNATLKDILPFISHDDFIFNNNLAYLTESNIEESKKSIMLIKVKNVILHTQDILYNNGEVKEKTKINFTYNSRQYVNLSVTDRDYFGKNSHLDEALLVVSLPAESYNGYYYKFVSKIILVK